VHNAPERLKKDGGHSERGFLGSGEASAKEQVQSNPVTEPKRSQNPKGPLPSSIPPDGYRIALNALTQINSGIEQVAAIQSKWQQVEDASCNFGLHHCAKANFQFCANNTRELEEATTVLCNQLHPFASGADRPAAATWQAMLAGLRHMLDALASMAAQFPRVIFAERLPIPMMRKEVSDARGLITASIKQSSAAALEVRGLLQQRLAAIAPATPPAPADAPNPAAAPNQPNQPNPGPPPVQSVVCLPAPQPVTPPSAESAIPVIIANITHG
jgi:hypothetical protein